MALTQISTAGVKDDAVTAGKIPANAVGSSELADNAVDTAAIAADAVTGAKIADDAINSEHYTDGSIDTAHIADSQITTAKIANNAVDTQQITNNAVTNVKIAGSSVVTSKIASSAVTTSKIADNSITTALISDANVTNAKLANDAVTTSRIADNSVTSAKIADNAVVTAAINGGAVTNAKLAADAVTNAKIADDAIDSEHYVDGSIDEAHIASGAVTQTKIGDGSIINAKVDNAAAIAGTKISPNFGSQNIETTGTLAVDGEFQPHWIGHQSQCTENTHNTTVYWKVAELTGGGTEGGTIDFYGTDSYSSNSGNYAAGRTTLIVRHTTDNKLDGIYWSESGGWGPVRDICWKYTGSNNVYEIWVKKGAYNNVVPHITGSFDHVQTFGSSTGSGTLPSGATAFDNRWSLKMKDDSSDAISVDNEGLVTYPTRPCFHGGSSGNISQSNIVEYDTVHVNRGSHYATSNDRFVCPCDGIYYISFFGMSHTNVGTMDIALRKNGSDYQGLVPYSGSGGGTYHHVAGSALITCSENDYLQVYVHSGSFYGTGSGRHTGFTVFLVA